MAQREHQAPHCRALCHLCPGTRPSSTHLDPPVQSGLGQGHQQGTQRTHSGHSRRGPAHSKDTSLSPPSSCLVQTWATTTFRPSVAGSQRWPEGWRAPGAGRATLEGEVGCCPRGWGVGRLECWPSLQGTKVPRLLTGPKPATGPAVSFKQVPHRPHAPRVPSAGRRRPCRGPVVHQKGTRMGVSSEASQDALVAMLPRMRTNK